jgi:hypothetical protein
VFIGGAWVGLGLGDISPEIRKIKTFMRKKFRSYAGHLADTDVYDQQMVEAVMEMQRRYGLPPTGIIGASLKEKMGYWKPPPPPDNRPVLFTVCGTGVPWWVGPDADVARAVEHKWRWQPVGYPATPFPMNGSVKLGRGELKHLININLGPFALCGFSQGAIVCGQVYKHDLLDPAGDLHDRLPDLKRALMFGNPMRQKGVVAEWIGNKPTGRGISNDRIENTPAWWKEATNKGDIYGDTPDDDTGEFQEAIFHIVMNNWFSGGNSIFAQVFEITSRPLPEVISAVKAIVNGIMFIGKGTGPHINHELGPAIEHMRAA